VEDFVEAGCVGKSENIPLENNALGSSPEGYSVTETTCPLCNTEEENTLHMLFKCEKAASIWKGLGPEDTILEAMGIDQLGAQVMELLLKSLV
jgi:hypothetical protein